MGSGISRLQKKSASQQFTDRTNGGDTATAAATTDRASTFTTYSGQSSDLKCPSLENVTYWLPKSYEEQDRLMGVSEKEVEQELLTALLLLGTE